MVKVFNALNGKFVFLEQIDDQPCFKSEAIGLPKVAVITTPKAGTYLLGKMLELAGWTDCEIHASRYSFTDYRGLTALEKRQDPSEREVLWPVNLTSALVRAGQFIVGHLPADDVTQLSLQDFKIIHCDREMRASFVSWARFMIASRRLPGSLGAVISWHLNRASLAVLLQHLADTWLAMAEPVKGWRGQDGVFSTTFELLMGDQGIAERNRVLGEMSRFLGLERETAMADALAKAGGQETKTWSGGRTDVSRYWSDEAEHLFHTTGLHALNASLGF